LLRRKCYLSSLNNNEYCSKSSHLTFMNIKHHNKRSIFPEFIYTVPMLANLLVLYITVVFSFLFLSLILNNGRRKLPGSAVVTVKIFNENHNISPVKANEVS
jgi:hypothetical protein